MKFITHAHLEFSNVDFRKSGTGPPVHARGGTHARSQERTHARAHAPSAAKHAEAHTHARFHRDDIQKTDAVKNGFQKRLKVGLNSSLVKIDLHNSPSAFRLQSNFEILKV